MNHSNYEKMIDDYNLRARESRNAALRSRLARPCSREEIFNRLAGLANLQGERCGREILLTKASAPSIMAGNEVVL